MYLWHFMVATNSNTPWYLPSAARGENMAFPEGSPAIFTVGPSQEMEDKVIMTVEKVGDQSYVSLCVSSPLWVS